MTSGNKTIATIVSGTANDKYIVMLACCIDLSTKFGLQYTLLMLYRKSILHGLGSYNLKDSSAWRMVHLKIK